MYFLFLIVPGIKSSFKIVGGTVQVGLNTILSIFDDNMGVFLFSVPTTTLKVFVVSVF